MALFGNSACFDNLSVKTSKSGYFFLFLILTVLIGCQTTSISDLSSSKAAEGFNPQETNKLFIVDCLLPGQIRKLGSQMTYLTARRPIKTTAGDCEIRGGEYVAYDRADLASALKVWLPQAQQGDVEAQVTVGEIYQKGLGGVADPALAAQWYLKAAEQGNARAQINLGYLYEKGLGVKQDKTMAINWYRKASGLANSDLQFATVTEATAPDTYQRQLEALRQESRGYQEEAKNLREQLDSTTQELAEQKQKSHAIEEQLNHTRSRLNQEMGKSTRNEQLIQSLQQEVENKQSSLRSQQQQVSKLESKLKNELENINAKPETEPLAHAERDEQQIKRSQKKLREMEARLKALEAENKRLTLKNQQQRVSKSESTSKQDSKRVTAKPEAQPIAKAESSEQQINFAQTKLREMEARLKALENDYQASAVQINADMAMIDEKTQQAKTTQDNLYIESLRGKLAEAKKALQAQGSQIKELKNSLAEEQQSLALLEKQPVINTAQAGPVIEIIDPPMTLTRGEPSYQLRSVVKTQDIVGKVTSSSGLKSLEVNQQPIQIDKDGMFKSEIAIEDTATAVKIVATDKQDRHSIVSFNLLIPSPEVAQTADEAPVKVTSDSFPAVNFGKFYALIIGNNEYAHLPTLKTSVNDAQAVNEILRTRYGYKTTLLVNANRHQIMTAFNELRKALTAKDNLLIYYAGHGDIDKSDQSAYWLPTDAETNNPANWLSSINITEYLNVIPAKHILVIADSCYSGALTEGSIARLPNEMPEDKREKWLNFMMNRKARTVMTSGGVQPVLDTGNANHSVFANALLTALKSNQGLMVDYELYGMIANQVKKSAAAVGFQQSPQYSALQNAGHEGSPFFFVSRSSPSS